jgi:hypothetical protein
VTWGSGTRSTCRAALCAHRRRLRRPRAVRVRSCWRATARCRLSRETSRRLVNPALDHRSIVQECHLARMQVLVGAHPGKLATKMQVRSGNTAGSRQPRGTRQIRLKPVTYRPDRFRNIVVVGPDILPRNIGAVLLIPVPLSIEDQASLRTVLPHPKALGPQKDAQFQGHVEARKPVDRIETSP